MGLGGVVDHGVGSGHEAVDQGGIADVAHDELDAVRGQARDVLGVAGVGQLVEHRDVYLRMLAHDVVDEVGADEAAAAGDDDALGLEDGVGHDSPSSRCLDSRTRRRRRAACHSQYQSQYQSHHSQYQSHHSQYQSQLMSDIATDTAAVQAHRARPAPSPA